MKQLTGIKSIKVRKEGLKNHHRFEEPQEIRQLTVTQGPGLDPALLDQRNGQHLRKDLRFINSIVAT